MDALQRKERKQVGKSMVVPKKINYTQVFNNHFAYRHVVDNHNNFRMIESCIEKIWWTMIWKKRVFSLIIAISEVNIWLVRSYFRGDNTKLLNVRTNIARELVYNPWL